MTGDLIRDLTAQGEEEDRSLGETFAHFGRSLGTLARRFDRNGGVAEETQDAIEIVPEAQKESVRAAIEKGLTKCESPIEKAILPWLVAQRYQFFDYRPAVLFPGENDQYVPGTLAVIPQLPIGRYRADFALAGNLRGGPIRFVVIECDGREFHDGVANVVRDVNRDVAILANNRVLDVVRIDGSQIMHSPRRAAEMAAEGLVFAWSVTNKANAHKFGVRTA